MPSGACASGVEQREQRESREREGCGCFFKKKMDAFSHVSQSLAALDPHAAALAPMRSMRSSAETLAESAELLSRARPVIRALAQAANFPDLVTKPTTHRALSNLGDFLVGHRNDPVCGEAHRALLMDATVDEDTILSILDEDGQPTIDRPKATLKRKPLCRLSIEEMDALEDPADRLACVPIRGQPAVAKMVTGMASEGAEVELVFVTGASVTLRRMSDLAGDPCPSVSMAISQSQNSTRLSLHSSMRVLRASSSSSLCKARQRCRLDRAWTLRKILLA